MALLNEKICKNLFQHFCISLTDSNVWSELCNVVGPCCAVLPVFNINQFCQFGLRRKYSQSMNVSGLSDYLTSGRDDR